MARCSGCSGDRCSCRVIAGPNVRVDGTGTNSDPYVISAEGDGGGGDGGESSAWSPGDIKMVGYATAPAGWLVANGQAVSRTTYASLFSAIGTVFGAGDGNSTFNLPDLAGRFPLGADGSHARGAMGGKETAKLTMANVPAHVHTISHTHDASHNHTASSNTVNLDHSHRVEVSGGGHEHTYSGNVNRQNYQAGGTFGGTFSEQNREVLGDGGHTHKGETQGVTGGLSHAHSITVNTRTLSTGAPSQANSGSTGQASPSAFSIMPPWTGVTFIIRT